MPRFSNRRAPRRYVRGLRRGRRTFRRRVFRRYFRKSRGRFTRRFRSKRSFSSRGVKKFIAVQANRENAFQSDARGGGTTRSFLLIGTQNSSLSTQNSTAVLPSGSTWGSYWRVPAIVYDEDVVNPTTTSTLIGPQIVYTSASSSTTNNAPNCGFSQNECFRIGDITASVIIPWARMYRYVRLKKIHIKYTLRRSMMIGTHNPPGAAPVYANITAARAAANIGPALSGGPRRGGDMVWMCTSRTGPVPDETVTQSELIAGIMPLHTAYAEIRKNPQLRRKAVFRNDVAFGMRPVKFSFTPTYAAARFNNSQAPLSGQDPRQEKQGLMSSNNSTGYSRNPSSSIGYRYKRASWVPMVMPHFPAKSSEETAGIPGLSSTAIDGPLVLTSSSLSSAFEDQVGRWLESPYFGMFMGVQVGTADVWPRNLRRSVSYELEFKGLRNFEAINDLGQPQEYFKDWGLLPTARMY